MNVTTIHQFLRLNIAPNPKDVNDQQIMEFVTELQESRNVNETRLLYCIGIDVKSSIKHFHSIDPGINSVIAGIRQCIIDSFKFAGLTTRTCPNGLPPQLRFSLALEQLSPAYYSPCTVCRIDQHHYSRVTSFQSFLRYVVKPNISPDDAVALFPADIDDTSVRRYLNEFLINGKFKNVPITRLGRMNTWVFVADDRELGETGYLKSNKAVEIIDRLGFYIENTSPNHHYICLQYGENFDEEMFQPDALTGDWGRLDWSKVVNGGEVSVGNEFFLSHPNVDGWGRTQSVTGDLAPFRERVHRNFDYNGTKYYRMTVESVGTIAHATGKGNVAVVIGEATARFNNA